MPPEGKQQPAAMGAGQEAQAASEQLAASLAARGVQDAGAGSSGSGKDREAAAAAAAAAAATLRKQLQVRPLCLIEPLGLRLSLGRAIGYLEMPRHAQGQPALGP